MNAVLKALSNPRRREILRLVWRDERTVGDLRGSFPDEVTLATVSEHLRLLTEAGLVATRRSGRCRFYRARPEALGTLREWLEAQWAGALDRLALLAELEAARRGPRARRRKKAPQGKERGR
jgi:DNA-binding transcriptional ArsR family regulator